MKRKNIFITFLVIIFLFISSCSAGAKNTYNYVQHSGAIGSFDLLSPTNNQETITVPKFSWQEADNADSYTLEVCSSTNFNQVDDIVYIKKTGIIGTSFEVSAGLKNKDCNYYWKVTAKNLDNSKRANQEYGSFYLKANSDEEIDFPTEYVDEWSVHELGSQANVAIDNSNFFNNNKPSLVISFDERQTNTGNVESDGWIVVTHPQETEMYGVDAFKFNFYYSGQNSRILLRVMDDDNEYWNAEIKLANNNKQTVFIRFDEFTLRTKSGSIIANQIFDYNYIKCIELVFEETFGDGVCLISDIKAVSYQKYSNLFFQKFDFNGYNEENIIFDNYNFDLSFADDGSSMTMAYSSGPNANNDTGINGYGFTKLVVNKFMQSGDAFKLKFRYSGAKDANILLRVLEEDDDRWVYRQSVKTLSDDYIIIPYLAFALSEAKGDGSRQFYFMKQLQLGIEKNYSTGSITIEDLEIVSLSKEIAGLYDVEIQNDGLVDDFNSYTDTAQIYYKWQCSTSNKDEAMELNSEFAFGTGNKCVKLGYKSDMGPAYYGARFVNSVEGYDAVSFWAYDYSIKNSEACFNYLGDVSAKCIVSLFVNTGEEYMYVIDALDRHWTNYTIAFSDFSLVGEHFGDVTPLVMENIAGFRIGLQYYYYLENGSPMPVYANKNPVYFDNVKFVNATETSSKELATKLLPDENDANVTLIDDFDGNGASEFGLMWQGDVALEKVADNQFMKLAYSTKNVSSAAELETLFDSACKGKAICFKAKGNGNESITINIDLTRAATTFTYSYTINNLSSDLSEYIIGFDNFTKIVGTGSTALSSKYVPNITKVSLVVKNSVDEEASYVLIDDVSFNATYAYDTIQINKVGE